MHFHRENSEILGGRDRESGTVLNMIGFNKKFNFENTFDMEDDDDSTSSSLRTIPDQIHNKIPDEFSFTPNFISDTELEREFFREFEIFGSEMEGSVG
jgi:hypothetical protein